MGVGGGVRGVGTTLSARRDPRDLGDGGGGAGGTERETARIRAGVTHETVSKGRSQQGMHGVEEEEQLEGW